MVSETLSSPEWSPDRRRFAIAKAHDGDGALSTIEADGSNDPRPTSAGEAKLPSRAPPYWSGRGWPSNSVSPSRFSRIPVNALRNVDV